MSPFTQNDNFPFPILTLHPFSTKRTKAYIKWDKISHLELNFITSVNLVGAQGSNSFKCRVRSLEPMKYFLSKNKSSQNRDYIKPHNSNPQFFRNPTEHKKVKPPKKDYSLISQPNILQFGTLRAMRRQFCLS